MRSTLLFLLFLSNTAIAQVNLSQGLMAYYPFTGNANDASGNNNHAADNNATLINDRFGVPNNAYHFNGTNNSMRVPNSPTLNMTNQISLCAWVKPMGFSTALCHGNSIMDKGITDFIQGNYFMRYSDAGSAGGQHCNGGPPDITRENFLANNAIGSYTPFIQLNTWYSVVYTYDGTTERLYVNCELKVTRVTAGMSFTNSHDLYIGRFFNTSFPYWMDGDLDELRIYNRPLNQAEINVYGGCANPGPPLSNVINTYTPVLGLDICTNKITVENATGYNPGDTVLMIQMKGAVIDSSNTANFGTITDYKNAGKYEFNYVKTKTGNVIELTNKIIRQYDVPFGKVQLVRVPYLNGNATVVSTLTCLPWDGSKGGILVANVKDTLFLNADIDVSGKGFRGGTSPNTGSTQLYCFRNDYYYAAGDLGTADKGEGISSLSSSKSWGKGSIANGGGSGNGHNSGGGGGANNTSGGLGGYQLLTCGSAPFDNRGVGGHLLNYSNALNTVFMGGGGGSGHTDNAGGSNMEGGNGGGIVILLSDRIQSNGFKIMSNGNNARQCNFGTFTDCHDGSGGGGAGGSILIQNNNYIDPIQVDAKGGIL